MYRVRIKRLYGPPSMRCSCFCSGYSHSRRGNDEIWAVSALRKKAYADVRPDRQTQSLWVALAACGSALLLAVTNHVTQNIASVPFLWVIPLGLYLFSFILCFDRAAGTAAAFFFGCWVSRWAG